MSCKVACGTLFIVPSRPLELWETVANSLATSSSFVWVPLGLLGRWCTVHSMLKMKQPISVYEGQKSPDCYLAVVNAKFSVYNMSSSFFSRMCELLNDQLSGMRAGINGSRVIKFAMQFMQITVDGYNLSLKGCMMRLLQEDWCMVLAHKLDLTITEKNHMSFTL